MASFRVAPVCLVIPGCAVWRRPGIHNHHREYGFRARAKKEARPGMMVSGGACHRWRPQRHSITACSGAADCARSAALVEPIMIASGIEPRMNIITNW